FWVSFLGFLFGFPFWFPFWVSFLGFLFGFPFWVSFLGFLLVFPFGFPFWFSLLSCLSAGGGVVKMYNKIVIFEYVLKQRHVDKKRNINFSLFWACKRFFGGSMMFFLGLFLRHLLLSQ
ncbi:MAG: hypothetical protein Q7U47_04285, partial [Paludibacter sp.]|nr:hypothetical protein [Paludibacter sp.]